MTEAVSASALGAHLGLSRQRIAALADVEHVISRLPCGGFDQDACRLKYLAWLRDPARRSARAAAASEFEKARARLLQLKIAEREGVLMMHAEHIATIDEIIGVLRTALRSLPARASRDLHVRRQIETVVRETLQEIGDIARRKSQEA
jgi:hypothetical protein